KTLLETGVQPEILVCRTEHPISKEMKKKLALFCNVKVNSVIEAIDVSSIYEVPLHIMSENLDKVALAKLKLPIRHEPDMESWKEFLFKLSNYKNTVDIGLVGKYTELPDAYKSIRESFIHAGTRNDCKVQVHYIPSETLNAENIKEKLGGLD